MADETHRNGSRVKELFKLQVDGRNLLVPMLADIVVVAHITTERSFHVSTRWASETAISIYRHIPFQSVKLLNLSNAEEMTLP